MERALDRERRQASPNYDELCRRFLADNKDFSLENLSNLDINKFYIIIDKKNNNLGLLFFKNSSNKFSVIYDIMICKSNVDIININNVINICINDLINLSNGNLNKIRISINSDENFHFIEEILKNGFKKSVILSHEYGLNLHKIIFERIL